MPGRILIVDDILSNVKLLESKLAAQYYSVDTAQSGAECLEKISAHAPDLITLDIMMPAMDGFEVCRQIREAPASADIPIIIVTALDQPSDRVAGLECGADDFLTKPVDDNALFVRVKNLLSWKGVVDELKGRPTTTPTVLRYATAALIETPMSRRILVVEDRAESIAWFTGALQPTHEVSSAETFEEALLRVKDGDYDLIVVSLGMRGFDGLRLCSQLRSLPEGRHVPILAVVSDGDRRKLTQALEMGVNDYLTRPVDRNELVARVRTQLRKKIYIDRLRTPVSDDTTNFSSFSDALSRQDPLGAGAKNNAGHISLVFAAEGASSNSANITLQFHGELVRKLQVLRTKTDRLGNSKDWADLVSATSLLADELRNPIHAYENRAMTFWSLSVSLGSFLEQSRAARSDNASAVSPLDSDVERALSDLVVTTAPFVRSFDAPRRFDSELVSFNAPGETIESARRIADRAYESSVLTNGDATLLKSALSAPAANGPQARKAHGFGFKTVLNVLGTALVIVASGGVKKIAEKIIDKAADQSQLVNRLSKMLLETEADVVAMYNLAAPDQREAAIEFLRDTKQKAIAKNGS